MIGFRLRTAFLFLCLTILCAGLRPNWSAPSLTSTAGNQATPYERNPFIFSTPQEALQALKSPDILQRRSGIEYLGRLTYTAYGMSTNQKNFDVLDAQKGLTEDLIRAIQEMPKDDSQQAERLLVLLGPKAQKAIPIVCNALVEQGSQNVFDRYEVMNTLIHLCGGPSAVGPKLAALMKDPEPATRNAAAGAAGLCDDIGFNHIGPPPNDASVLSPSQSPIENINFRARVLPALTRCIDDPVTTVRLTTLRSLEALTYSPSDACSISYAKAFDIPTQKAFDALWQKTLPPLARAITSSDSDVRLAALRVLAYMPGDVSPLAAALRGELHDGKDQQAYALAALCHAAGTNRTLVASVFLKTLSSQDLTQRRQAAADVSLMVMPLWNGGFFPGKEPLRWWNDDRLFARYGDPSLTPKQKDEEARKKQAAQEQIQQHLLSMLVQATSDSDTTVRDDAALSLDLIGQWAEAASSHGFLFASKVKSDLTVKQALVQAAVSLQMTDSTHAKHFQEMSTYLWERPGMGF